MDPCPELRQLLTSVAEQLKVPLAVIARHAELGTLTGDASIVDTVTIATQADAALLLVDSYLLGLELLHSQAQLELEPISASSLVVDIAHDLYGFARQYGVNVDLQTNGRFGPVMSNLRGLRAAILSLGFAFIEAQAAGELDAQQVVLAAHRTPRGVVIGLYGMNKTVTSNAWRRALSLYGTAAQPFTELSPTSGAGLFIADTILRCMDSRLRVGRYQQRSGLAVTLQPSRQLQLV